MMEFEKITKEHAELFPKATAESQFVKLEEEITELEEAKTGIQTIKELADIIIVCAGLNRWFPKTARAIAKGFYKYAQYEELDELVEAEIKRKWNVNQLREWVWDGKTYQHKGRDGNE